MQKRSMRMVPLLGLLSLAVLLMAPGLRAQAVDSESKPAVAAADAWVQLVDKGSYDESWRAASGIFRSAITRQKWVDTLLRVRDPLGTLVSRKLDKARLMSSLPGMPDGHYAVLTYNTIFAHKAEAVETLTLAIEGAGDWRVAGYFIR